MSPTPSTLMTAPGIICLAGRTPKSSSSRGKLKSGAVPDRTVATATPPCLTATEIRNGQPAAG